MHSQGFLAHEDAAVDVEDRAGDIGGLFGGQEADQVADVGGAAPAAQGQGVEQPVLLGLRALFFLGKGLLDRLVYLSTGLSIILAFIGVKLILHWLHEDITKSAPEISTPISLVVILGILVITTVASLVKSRNDPDVKAHAGSLRGHSAKDQRPADR